MRRFLLQVQVELNALISDLNSEPALNLKIVARTLAKLELQIQAARSLLEARLFEDEIDNMRAPQAAAKENEE